jgi:hypothetical protein
MENDFLDGIDETFQKMMSSNGNGKRNGHSVLQSREDRLIREIVNHLHNLSKPQQEEVLGFVRSLTQR